MHPQAAAAEQKALRAARSRADASMDEAVEEVAVLQGELRTIKARLTAREATDSELQEQKRQRAKLEQVCATN